MSLGQGKASAPCVSVYDMVDLENVLVTQAGPIVNLSDDILAEIFLCTKPSAFFATDGTCDIWDVNALAAVCQQWLLVVKATRACWARVEVTDERASRGWGMVQHVNKELDAYLRRSRGARLCIKLNVARGVPGYASSECPTLVATLLQHAHRWGSLTVDLGNHRDILYTQLSFIVPCLGDMPLLRFIRLQNTGKAAFPWLTILETLAEGIPRERSRQLDLRGLELHSAKRHRDQLKTLRDMDAGLCILGNLTQIRAHVAPNVAVKMLQLCTLLLDAEFEFTMPRRTRVVPWSGGLVVHSQLSHLSVKTSPYPRIVQRRSFPHDAFAVVLDNLVCPSLSSLTLEADALGSVRPMGRHFPADETAHMERIELQMRSIPHLDGPSDPPSEQEVEDDGDDDNDGDETGGKSGSRRCFFPTSLEKFLVNSPSLRNLVLDSIPLHSSHLTRLFTVTPKLVDLTIFEWEMKKTEDAYIQPELLSDKAFLDWMACEDNLPNLRHLQLLLLHSFETGGPLTELLNTLTCQGLKSAIVKCKVGERER
ncbi:hypothetical protein AAF712_016672 [Marasmius tenuissimus]|uniref:F-box domain-containing protein n=1 Tax=Marasmius tenuissimus TaxID=585030 RepID=A0ABR2Z667_9AGAR